ncbi:MAG: YebC/PmpR family DNA-binding transcriptional regulator [bacterium]
MSGHSRWAGIKHKKAAVDAKRGKIFTKIIREISVAAKQSGGNPDNNPRLRKAMEQAREVNMPADNIKKAVQRGTGELPGSVFEELMYEGYGPGGVAVMCESTTDNKNRTAGDIRRIFTKHGGNLGESGCVSWMFNQKGFITIEKKDIEEDKLMGIALDAGAEDLNAENDLYEITTQSNDFNKVTQAIKEKNIPIASEEITMLAQTNITLTGKEAEQMLELMNDLDEHDDVKNVFSNFDISKEEIENFNKD